MGCAASIRETLSKNSLTVDRNHFYFAKVIGNGGFGTVFSAMHVDYHSWFAVKQINKVQLMKHKSGLDMIMGELTAWKKVDHHHYISDLHFAFQDRSYCYFVMDLLTGADLRYYVKKRLILTEPELAFLVACMSSALNHLHTRGILHRDIKPENVVFDHEGFPYLTDFGVSYICEEDMKCFLSSGTKQYLAPEVFGKTHEHGPESDFWSLGVMIYEIIYGKRPFDKHVPREFINHVEYEMAEDLRRARGSTSPVRPRHNSNSPPGSPFNASRGASPIEADTCLMSGAVSLANTKTPPPSARRMSPTAPAMQHSKSQQNVSPRSVTPRALIAEYSASKKEVTETLKLPDVCVSSKSKISQKKGKFPAMGSLSAASSLVELLRHEEVTRRAMLPGNTATSYTLPRSLPFLKHPDEVIQFESPNAGDQHCSSPDVPETDEPQAKMAMHELNVSEFTETDDSADSALVMQSYAAPLLPSSLRVPLPLVSMYHEQVSPHFLNFLEELMEIRPKYRLGGLKNYRRLQNHSFFSHTLLSWPDIEAKKASPPFVPNREQIQFDMQHKHGDIDIDELDSVRLREFLAGDKQKLFEDYHHIAKEYKELFPNLVPHKVAPGVTPLKCRS